jgi:general secretion pathway protein F
VPCFRYQAIDADGKQHRAKITSHDIAQARKQLRQQGLTITHIKTQRSWLHAWHAHNAYKLSLKQRLLVTQQLAMLLDTGMPLAQSLQSLAQQHSQHADLFQGLHRALANGQSLSHAMLQYPKAFAKAYCAAIAAGESSDLKPVLKSLAQHLKRQLQNRHQIQQALWYPIIMLGFASLILVFLLSTILPNLAQALQDTGQPLAWSTRSLLHLGSHMQHYGAIDLACLLLAIMTIRHGFQRYLTWRYWMQQQLLLLPVIGKTCSHGAISAFLATLGMLLSNGIHLHQALSIAKALITWQPIRDDISEAITQVQSGKALHQALASSKYMPTMTLQIMQCASINGCLGPAIGQCAEDLSAQHQRHISTLLTLLEPMLVLAMGTLVLWIVLGTLLPIFSFNSAI